MTAFLLDANVSPETAAFLRATFGHDVVEYARQTKWVFITPVTTSPNAPAAIYLDSWG